MSNAGRPPLPTWLKELRGTLQPGERDGEPRPEDAIYVPPPAGLTNRPLACEFWEVHLPLLVKNKMISEVDMTQFAMLCLAFEEMIEAEQDVRTNGKVIRTENGYLVQSPYVSMAAQRRKEFNELSRDFGLTPSGRSRIKVQLLPSGRTVGQSERDEHQAFFEF
jgi:P27 family predicted phage terminase small subunit